MGSSFGGTVGAELCSRHEDILCRYQDDVTACALGAEMPGRLAQQQERTVDIDALDALKGREVHLLKRGHHGQTGIDDDQIDSAPGTADGVESLLNRFTTSDV